MKKEWLISLKAILVLTLLLGIIYPAIVWGVGQITMSHQVNGSLIQKDGETIGSELLGQTFTESNYFWSRPSCHDDTNPVVAAGSNEAVTSKAYQDVLQTRIQEIQKLHPGQTIPVELVTCSASGFDPHLSIEGAMFQAERVAKSRGMALEDVEALITKESRKQWLNLFGNSYVNVLQLNQALDRK